MNKRAHRPLLRTATWLAIGCLLLILGGCTRATRVGSAQRYGLGPAPALTTDHIATATHAAAVLQVARITAPEWLAGSSMYYRLDYEDGTRLAAYTLSSWIAPPAALLEPVIEHTLAASHHWRAVVGPRSAATANTRLQIHLDDFSQTFSQPQRSTGVIDATATLIDQRDGRVISQRRFRLAITAPAPDARGGVAALAQASRKLATQVQDWLQTITADL